ncbi:deor [Agrilactobacillus composti DSM 18527 = JCM 14202]|uniref:Deor n=2 Tax=Agrilactobacillus TaxID=2767875 RepID=A0A0R1XZ72_9LACO|nr:deor [Agrilactobacillus composti DSM 18527 = JCM 14202]
MVKISDMYYIQGLTQKEISERAHIHRTEISRILKDARAMGIVNISINTETETAKELEDYLIRKFGLKKAVVVPNSKRDDNDLNALSIYASLFISKLVKSGEHIGLGWGSTLFSVINAMDNDDKKDDVTVLPIVGGPMGKLIANYHVNHLAHVLADKFNGTGLTLDTPAFVSNEELKKELIENPNIREIIQLWRQLDIAIFGIGSALITDAPEWQAFYKNTNFKSYFSGNMVGDILSHPYDIHGAMAPGIQNNLIAMPLEQLKTVPYAIGIAYGTEKVDAILGALRGGWLNCLITTENTAHELEKATGNHSQM